MWSPDHRSQGPVVQSWLSVNFGSRFKSILVCVFQTSHSFTISEKKAPAIGTDRTISRVKI